MKIFKAPLLVLFSMLLILTACLSISEKKKVFDNEQMDTNEGPFEPTEQYVTTYKDDIIYVKVLDWKGRNVIELPSVIDRPIIKAWILGDTPNTDYPIDLVRQHPWGLYVIVPEDRMKASHTVVALQIEGNASELIKPRLIDANPSQAIFLMGDAAKLEGGLDYSPGPDLIQGWISLDQAATWRVQVPTAGDYEVVMTYACGTAAEGSVFEIASGKNIITHKLAETNGYAGDSQNFEEKHLKQNLQLSAGVNTLSLRAIKKEGTDEMMRLYTLKLISPATKEAMMAARERAERQRADTDWFVAAKYGVMFHWTPGTYPRHGSKKSFPEAVKDFDVIAFADMVEQTGAGYVIFTAPHGIQWFPGPIQSIEKVIPGRTCQRDLIGDMIDALDKRGIKFIMYYHQGVGDYEWVKASGFNLKDKTQFFENEKAILTEIGLRYGNKLAGFWFDDRYPMQPFEELYQATKTGNPNRIVAFNSWILPKSTEFQDYFAGEFGDRLFLPDSDYFSPDGPAAGLQPHGMIYLDDVWAHGRPDTEIAPPIFETTKLIDYVQQCIAREMVITMNMSCYQDGTVSPATMKQMKNLRQVIRGR
ncbi:MAG: alpha-L-fucosidase [Eubacteriaceae bacterium]|nr:alpha-L-fucosidase [Eubacteriaceae bacterium]